MAYDEADNALEELANIQEAKESERQLLEKAKQQRIDEQANLEKAKQDLSAYKEKVTRETQQWVTNQQAMIASSAKKSDERERKLKKREATAKSERAKVAAAKREIKKYATRIAREDQQARVNLQHSERLRREAEAEMKDTVDTRKRVQKKAEVMDREIAKIQAMRGKIEAELKKAKKMSSEQRERMVSWESTLAARESSLKLATDKVERRWLSLRSREQALEAAARELKLQDKI